MFDNSAVSHEFPHDSGGPRNWDIRVTDGTGCDGTLLITNELIRLWHPGEHEDSGWWPRDGIEPPPPAFSGMTSPIRISLILLAGRSPFTMFKARLLERGWNRCTRRMKNRPRCAGVPVLWGRAHALYSAVRQTLFLLVWLLRTMGPQSEQAGPQSVVTYSWFCSLHWLSGHKGSRDRRYGLAGVLIVQRRNIRPIFVMQFANHARSFLSQSHDLSLRNNDNPDQNECQRFSWTIHSSPLRDLTRDTNSEN